MAVGQLVGIGLGIALALGSSMARAETVGELMDKGGQKLDAAGVRAIMEKGVTLAGRNAAGFVGSTVYKADGTLTSSGTRERDNFTNGGSGTWTVDDGGKVCARINWDKGQGTSNNCYFWFKAGDDYFTAGTDAREQNAIKRTVGR